MTDFVQRVSRARHPIRPQLSQLTLELTERCNNDCVHCCINQPAQAAALRARELSTAQVQTILQQAADLGSLVVHFTGGEPLLRPDFEEIYVFARRLGMKVLLYTNARLISPRLVDLFVRMPPMTDIEITVYGMSPQTYEAVSRAPGSFAQFWRGTQLLLAAGVPFIVKQAFLPQNKAELPAFEAWAATLPGMWPHPPLITHLDLRSRRDDEAKNQAIAAMRLSPPEALAMLARYDADYRQEMLAFATRFMGPTGDRLFGCGASSGHSLCVDAYGQAQACMGLRAPEFTQPVTTASPALGDALARFSKLDEAVRATNPEYLRRCAQCFLKGMCQQCPAKSWAENGTLDTPVEYLCALAHTQARHLGWLAENENAWEVSNWRERINSER